MQTRLCTLQCLSIYLSISNGHMPETQNPESMFSGVTTFIHVFPVNSTMLYIDTVFPGLAIVQLSAVELI